MYKTKYRKTTCARPPGLKSDPRGGKSKFLEKFLSLTAQNHYADLEDTCRDKVTTGWCHCKIHQESYRKETMAGVIFDPGFPFEE